MKISQDAVGSVFKLDLEKEIKKCAQYLVETNELRQLLNSAAYDAKGLLDKLGSAERCLAAAVDHLQNLRSHFEMGRMNPHDRHEKKVRQSYESAIDAWVQVRNLSQEVKIFHEPKTRKMPLQQSAARLAYALVGHRVKGQARKITLEIIAEANLKMPDDSKLDIPERSSLTGWLDEFKNDAENVK